MMECHFQFNFFFVVVIINNEYPTIADSKEPNKTPTLTPSM